MRRREFITGVSGTVLAMPSSVRAQQSGKRPSVAFVHGFIAPSEMAGPHPTSPLVRAFVHGLRDAGWIDGSTVTIERRSAEGQPSRAPGIMSELVARGVNVIAMGGSKWLRDAAQEATTVVPTIVIFDANPVSEGLVKSLAAPSGNLTGVTLSTGPEFLFKRLQFLKETAPNAKRIACLASSEVLDSFRRIDTGLLSIFVPVDRSEQFDEAFATMLREQVDALVTEGSPIIFRQRQRIIAFATEHRLPCAFLNREAAEEGALMSYGINVPGLFGELAGYVDRVLKGAKPSDLPIQQPTRFELVINMKTVKALGLTVPPALLTFASDLIE